MTPSRRALAAATLALALAIPAKAQDGALDRLVSSWRVEGAVHHLTPGHGGAPPVLVVSARFLTLPLREQRAIADAIAAGYADVFGAPDLLVLRGEDGDLLGRRTDAGGLEFFTAPAG